MRARSSEAVWTGSLREGKGTIKFGSGKVGGTYSFSSRFEDGSGTNPEELIAAAQAGCFSMALSAGLGRSGYTPKRIYTRAKVHLEKVGEGFSITRIELETEAQVPGIDKKTFLDHAEAAKKECPVSRALAGVEILMKAVLTGL